jgi:hypothetical protein
MAYLVKFRLCIVVSLKKFPADYADFFADIAQTPPISASFIIGGICGKIIYSLQLAQELNFPFFEF